MLIGQPARPNYTSTSQQDSARFNAEYPPLILGTRSERSLNFDPRLTGVINDALAPSRWCNSISFVLRKQSGGRVRQIFIIVISFNYPR